MARTRRTCIATVATLAVFVACSPGSGSGGWHHDGWGGGGDGEGSSSKNDDDDRDKDSKDASISSARDGSSCLAEGAPCTTANEAQCCSAKCTRDASGASRCGPGAAPTIMPDVPDSAACAANGNIWCENYKVCVNRDNRYWCGIKLGTGYRCWAKPPQAIDLDHDLQCGTNLDALRHDCEPYVFPLTCDSLCDRFRDECWGYSNRPDLRSTCMGDCSDNSDPQIIKCILQQNWQPWNTLQECGFCSNCDIPDVTKLRIGTCPELK